MYTVGNFGDGCGKMCRRTAVFLESLGRILKGRANEILKRKGGSNVGNLTEKEKKAYEEYVKKKTPVHNLPLNMLKAFITGGIICMIGEFILNYCEKCGLDKNMSGSWNSVILVLISVMFNRTESFIPKLAKWGGAGALVPITGFANSVAAPAIEYKKKDRLWESAVRFLPLPGRSFYMEYSQAGFWDLFTGWQERQVSWDDPENKRSSESFFHRDTVSDQQRVCCRQKRGRGTAGKFV